MKKVIAAMVMVGMLVAMVMAGTCLADGNDPWKLVVIFLQPEGLPGNMPTPVLSTTPFMTYGACEAASAFIETWQANLGVYYGIYTQTSCVKD